MKSKFLEEGVQEGTIIIIGLQHRETARVCREKPSRLQEKSCRDSSVTDPVLLGRHHQHWPHRAQQQRAAATLAPRNEEAGAAKAAP